MILRTHSDMDEFMEGETPEENRKDRNMEVDLDAYIEALKSSEVSTHYWHLQTNSYAQHMALGGYYEGLQGLVDALAEGYQGKYGKRVVMPPSIRLTPMSNMDNHFSDLAKMTDRQMEDTAHCPEIQDLVIAISEHINKTRYLLTLR